jgi:DNA-binding transcriptional ArsR family regulator
MDVKPFDFERFARWAPEMSEFVKSLANPVRLRILCELSMRESSVGALSRAVGAPMTAISQNLALLRKDKLVSFRRSNQMMFYALADERVARIIEALAEQFCKAGPNPKTGGSPAMSKLTGETHDGGDDDEKGLQADVGGGQRCNRDDLCS